MPDGQNGVLETFDLGVVNPVASSSQPLVAPLPAAPQYERPVYVLENYKWGNGTRGTAGGTITWAVVTTGQSVPANAEYSSEAAAVSSVFLPSIRQAFTRWDEVGNFSFVETTSPATANIVIVFDELQSRSSGTIGLANTWYSGNVIRNSYISFDIGRRYRLIDGTVQTVGSSIPNGTIDFYTLVLHEVGHALGLDHEDDFPTVMNASQNTSVTDLTSDEIAAIRAIYGTANSGPAVDDHPADASTTASLTVGGTFSGSVDSSTDEDWIRVSLTGGVTYRIDMRGYDSNGGTLLDPYVRLLTSEGTELWADDDSGTGTDSQILYTAPSTGTYYIAAKGFDGEQGTYTVALATAALADDYAASSSTRGAVTVGGTAAGRLETSTDTDWFAVTLTQGQTYRIDLRGSPTGGGTLADPLVRIRSAAGDIYATDDDTGTGLDAQLSYTATFTGVHYVEAATPGSGTGTYTLGVTSTAQGDDYPATTATTGSVPIGGTLAGAIGAAGDVDWARVTLTAGVLYRFDARGSASSGGTLADPALQLLNSSGAALVTDNDSGTGADARIFFRAAASGVYYLSASSNLAAATGTYTLAATANPDDFAASTATTGSVTAGGSVTGVVESAGDRDWFRTTLTAGVSYSIQVAGTATGSALRWTEASLILRNANGTQIGASTRSGLGAAAVLTYVPTTTGTYYIDALAYNPGVGAYTVSVTRTNKQTADQFNATEITGLGLKELEAVTAPPAIALSDAPLTLARSSTVWVDDPLVGVLAPPPADLFTPRLEETNPFMTFTPADPLFPQQGGNSYPLLPF